MKLFTRLQLSAMMFLEFFIWGAWFVTMGTYLMKSSINASGVQVGTAYLSQAIGAIIAPFIIGLIADRFFAAQKIMGVLHIVGAGLLWYVATAGSYSAFLPGIMAYMVLYMPTIALANSISFRQMTTPEKDFPLIRVLGTIGWIVANLFIAWFAWEKGGELATTFKMAAGASLLLGLFSFSLPNTPPPKAGVKDISMGEILGLDALALLKSRSYLVFFLASVALCIPLAFYYNFANPFLNEIGVDAAAGKMSMGQISEVFFMLLLPWFFFKLGVKKTLIIGMIAWACRYLLFAFGDNPLIDLTNLHADDIVGDLTLIGMLYGGIILHGVCYDFFFVTGQIYTENKAGARYKSAAQGLITLATYGVGMFIGYFISGFIVDANLLPEGGHNWEHIWLVPATIAGVVLVIFSVTFRDKQKG
ncbi:MAG: MFS transporter [Saprospiraceae bacterium]|nr:MAG: MFS transporter [Saprospiraceae bacterium]